MFVLSLSLGWACSSNGSAPAVADPSSTAAQPAPEENASTERAESERTEPMIRRAQAVQLAEAFVRDQGYTDAAATSPLQRESLEGDPSTMLERRRGTLRPRSVGAQPNDGEWMVLFARSGPGPAGSAGRAVHVERDGSLRMVHQDVRLPAAPEGVELVGRLVSMDDNNPHCGTMHFAVVAEYEVVEVLRGTYGDEIVMVIHGCPELPRSQYSPGAGGLDGFRIEDLHAMVLAPHTPEVTGGLAIMDTERNPDRHRYWAERTDAHRPTSNPR